MVDGEFDLLEAVEVVRFSRFGLGVVLAVFYLVLTIWIRGPRDDFAAIT